jgi:GNAT superfamily N-acetyltransferase
MPVSADEARAFVSNRTADAFMLRLVADRGGHPVATAQLADNFQLPKGWTGFSVTVAPEHRGRGLGSRLSDALMAALPADRIGLGSTVRDDDPVSRAFAEHRGFERHAHMFLSTLSPTDFEPDAWQPRLDRLARDGVAIIDLAQASDPDWKRLYALIEEVMLDEPATLGTSQIDYATFERLMLRGFNPIAFVVAVEGDRWLGASLMSERAPDEGHTFVTGVRREARGRGLAYALKIATILRARELGLSRVATSNDSRNAPMLAVNTALGYRRRPGTLLYRRALP